MKEKELVPAILEGGVSHDKALSFVYNNKEYRSRVFRFLKSKGLNKQECDEIWIDVVVKFGQLVIQKKYKHTGELIGYLKNMSNYLMLNFFRSKKRHQHVEIEPYMHPVDDELQAYNSELHDVLHQLLEQLEDTCKNILLLWSRDYKMKEIQEKLGLASPEATRKRKHFCLQKLLQIVKTNEVTRKQLESFLEN